MTRELAMLVVLPRISFTGRKFPLFEKFLIDHNLDYHPRGSGKGHATLDGHVSRMVHDPRYATTCFDSSASSLYNSYCHPQ